MKRFFRVLCKTLCVVFICLFAVTLLHGKDDFTKPKEFGVYVKTEKGLKRLVPNIVFNEKGVLFVEPKQSCSFSFKKDVQFFVIYGKYDLTVLTLNPLLFSTIPSWQATLYPWQSNCLRP